ncbi:FAD-dependent monooxygenase [Actinocorallia sp. API 0066]|uniref:FAD-dependent monooxygenase n=1 Tax=Actinocorallia sp. API 0066 TaxID=2896846 RepID=UPI001E30B569|nr:FAD-dependent monooxygenase [Actinocorallia sp. API 0066]MCD0452104.1 FAD-dependent monooxygenase [Actinocorallia sp. API 0066]
MSTQRWEAGRALIVGAGVAGLTAALRLHRGGWEVLVVEKATGNRKGGTWISFRGVGYQAAERLGILPRLVEAQLPWEDIHMVDTGGRLRVIWRAATQLALMNEPTLHVPRDKITEILLDALDGEVKIEYGTTVSSVTQDESGAEVVLSNGVSERFDLVIGADGVNSAVRELVFGPETEFRTDFGDLLALYNLERSPIDTGVEHLLSGVGRMIAVSSLGDTFSVIFLWTSTDLPGDLATDLSTSVRRRFEDLGWAVPALLREVEAVPSVYYGPVSQIKMDTWSQGRVVLVGDAAWCTGFYAGFGASLAVGGADLLGDVLERHPGDIPTALREWEAAYRPIALKVQAQARRGRESFFLPPTEFALALRTIFLRIAGNSVTTRLLRLFMGVRSPK